MSFGRIIGKGSGNGVSQLATHSEPGGFVKLQFVHTWDGNDYATNTDSASVSLNAWHHIVVTYNADATGNEAEKGTGLHAGVNLTENTEEGVGPTFQEQGFIKPPKVSLIESGFLGDCLVSPRSSKEWDVPTNGASDREVPQALELGPGNLPSTNILENLDRGLYIGDLWYVNYSDLISCRMTGLTRFATFWVEGGELQAPVNVVRFDETAYRDLGENLVDMTEEREFLPDSGTYRSRSSGSMKMPGALVEDFNVTM